MERVRTGVSNLDALLNGGFIRGDAVLVKGRPGAGKTVLGLQWVCRGAADLGEPGAIIVLEETPQQFYRRARAFGWDLKGLEEQNRVRIIFTSAEALSRDILNGSLLVGMLAEIGARRVVVDPISHYRLIYPDGRRLRQQVYATINALKRLGQTSLLTAEVGTAGWTDPAPEEYLADTVISLSDGPIEGRSFRRLEILKSSTYDYHPGSALFRIAPTGIQLITPFPPTACRLSEASLVGTLALGEELGGNLPAGSFHALQLETDVRRVTLDLALAAFTRPCADTLVYLGNSCVSPSELWETAVSTGFSEALSGRDDDRQTYLLEPFGRKRPPALPLTRFRSLAGYDGDEIVGLLSGAGGDPPLALQGTTRVVCDLSDMFYHSRPSKFQILLPRLVDAIKSQRASLVGVIDPRLMTQESHAWIQGMADAITRIWEAGSARFVQVVKSANRSRSEPRLLVETGEPPFFEVVE